jgi:hypothetical protein
MILIFITIVLLLAMADKEEKTICIPDRDYNSLLKALRKGEHVCTVNKFAVEEPVELRDGVMYEKNTNKRVVCKSEIGNLKYATNWGELLMEEGATFLFRSNLVSIIYSRKRGTIAITPESDEIIALSRKRLKYKKAESIGLAISIALAPSRSSNDGTLVMRM